MAEFTIFGKKYSIGKIVGTVTIIGTALFGAIEMVVMGVRFHDEYTQMYNDVQELKSGDEKRDTTIDRHGQMLNEFHNDHEKRDASYAVGFRVTKTKGGKEIKTYRNWNGEEHPVYLDAEQTDMYGIDSYFYVDESTGEKIYVW